MLDELFDRIENGNPQTELAIFKRIRRVQKDTRQTSKPICADSFTAHMCRVSSFECDEDAQVGILPFTSIGKLQESLERAVAANVDGKVAGPDGIPSEILAIDKSVFAQFLQSLWTEVGRLCYLPSLLASSTIVPILKTETPPP